MYISDDDVVYIPTIISDYSTNISTQTSMDEDLSEVVLLNIDISICSDATSSVVVTTSMNDFHAHTCQSLPSRDHWSTYYICSVESYVDIGCMDHITFHSTIPNDIVFRDQKADLGMIPGYVLSVSIEIVGFCTIANLGRVQYAPSINRNPLSASKSDRAGYNVNIGRQTFIAYKRRCYYKWYHHWFIALY
jgi:hypothetical protein